jgi:hypothetical protein
MFPGKIDKDSESASGEIVRGQIKAGPKECSSPSGEMFGIKGAARSVSIPDAADRGCPRFRYGK